MKNKLFIRANSGKMLRVGDIWWYDDSQTAMGTGKIRPCVIRKIIQITPNCVLIRIVPLTEWEEHFALASELVKVEPNKSNCLTKVSALDLCQEQPIPLKVLVGRLGTLSEEKFRQMLDAQVL